jgi:hypothetical protein
MKNGLMIFERLGLDRWVFFFIECCGVSLWGFQHDVRIYDDPISYKIVSYFIKQKFSTQTSVLRNCNSPIERYLLLCRGSPFPPPKKTCSKVCTLKSLNLQGSFSLVLVSTASNLDTKCQNQPSAREWSARAFNASP